MDIMELGAIGELVGGLAVIVSLVYVGLQVRQSNDVAKSASLREVTGEARQLFLWFCDPEQARLFRRALYDFDGLSHNDQMVVSGYLGAFFHTAQTTFAVRSSQRASQLEHYCASHIAVPGLSPWWDATKPTLNRKFTEMIEELAGDATPLDQLMPWIALDENDERGA